MLILTILAMSAMTISLSMKKPDSIVHARFSNWTYKYWHLNTNQNLVEEVLERQKKSGEKNGKYKGPPFMQFSIRGSSQTTFTNCANF